MKELLRRLFSVFFRKKKNTETVSDKIKKSDADPVHSEENNSVVIIQEPAPKPEPRIQHSPVIAPENVPGTKRINESPLSSKISMKNNLLHVHLYDRIDKFRCTSLERAREIVPYGVKGIFSDSNGNRFKIA